MGDILNFDMSGETPESFQAADTDPGSWAPEDHEDSRVAKSFLGDLQEHFDEKELSGLGNMLSTIIDDEGHGLGDSRLIVRAAARAARQFDAILRKRENTFDDGRAKGLNYHMPLTPDDRRGLVREAKRLLDLELMNARNLYIRRTGRSLPGWYR